MPGEWTDPLPDKLPLMPLVVLTAVFREEGREYARKLAMQINEQLNRDRQPGDVSVRLLRVPLLEEVEDENLDQ